MPPLRRHKSLKKFQRYNRPVPVEFYPTINVTDINLKMPVEEWQFNYNWHRPHNSLNGKTPLEKACELSDKTPFQDEVTDSYESIKERFQERNYRIDLMTSAK